MDHIIWLIWYAEYQTNIGSTRCHAAQFTPDLNCWKIHSQSPQTNFHRLHQFIFSFCLITFELFWTSIPIRIYHVIYCWVSQFFAFNLSKRWNISPLADNWSLLGNSLLEKWRRRKAFKIPTIHIVRSKRRKYPRCHSAMYCHICDFNRRLSFDIFMFALQMELYRKYSGIFSFQN